MEIVLKKNAGKSSIFSFKVSKLEEVSHEMLFLALQTLKLGGRSCILRGMRNTSQYFRSVSINRVAESRVARVAESSVARVAESS